MAPGEPRRLRSALRRLASPHVIGLPLFWISYVVFVLDGFPVFFGAPLDGQTLREPLKVVAFASVNHLVLFGLLVLARSTVLRLSAARRHPGWTIWSFLIAALISDTVASSLYGWAGPNAGEQPTSSLVDHGIFATVTLSILGVMVVAIREHREAVTSLQAAQGRLLETRARASLTLAQERSQAIARTTELVRSAVSTLDPERPADAIRTLRLAAEDVVRPMSHRLAGLPPDFAATPSPELPQPGWRRVVAEVGATPLISPILLGATLTLLSLRGTLADFESAPGRPETILQVGPLSLSADFAQLPEVLLEHVAVFTSAWLAGTVMRWALGRILPGLRIATQWVVTVAALFVGTGLGEALMSAAYRLPGMPTEAQLSWWARLLLLVPVVAVTFFVALNRAIARRRSLLRSNVARVNQDLAWEVAKTNELLWQERRELSRALHGPLQAALNAGAIQLDSGLRAGGVSAELVGDVVTTVERALESIDERGRVGPDLGHEIRILRSTWDGVCEVTFEAESRIRERLAADPTCAGVLVDILSEAVANAALHGQASRVAIRVSSEGSRLLRLTVTDNGTFRTDRTTGLGSAILDEVTTDWRLEFADSGAVLTALLPLDELTAEAPEIRAAAEPTTPSRVDVLP